jgi:hypothetical protein
MAKLTWQAYFFDSLDKMSPIARTAVIEAESEDDAGKIAVAQMGRCMRVEVARLMWGTPPSLTQMAGNRPRNRPQVDVSSAF